MTLPSTLRAARPMVWISERAERRYPSLSASRIATSETSGRSSPSRSRLIPTRTSNSPLAQAADDFDALDGLDVRVQVAHAHAEVVIVVGQILGHLLGQAGDQHARARLDPLANFVEQVVDLGAGLAHLDFGIDETGRTNKLLDHQAGRVLELVVARRGRDVNHLARDPLPFLEIERAIVERGGQPEAELDQRLLA